jgi:hypothetical protein
MGLVGFLGICMIRFDVVLGRVGFYMRFWRFVRICVLNVIWFILDLFGHPVTTYFDIPRFTPAHPQYLFILCSCDVVM